jgi:predicted nucleic acid-binding protein
MRAFIDTSSLFKKYIDEEGSDLFSELLKQVSEIIVSPVTWLEVHSILSRRLREKNLTTQQVDWIQGEIEKDFDYFNIVLWNELLEAKGIEVIQKYGLKTLDALQLAAGCISNPDLFITSDKSLFSVAKHQIKTVHLI